MEITIKGEAKEITALVLAVQERQMNQEISNTLLDLASQIEPEPSRILEER